MLFMDITNFIPLSGVVVMPVVPTKLLHVQQVQKKLTYRTVT